MSGGGKGGGAVTGYKYFMGLHFGLCHGPVDALIEIRAGDRTAWSGVQSASGPIAVNAPNLFGGDQKEGGIVGTARLMMGDPAQTPNAYLTAQQGAVQPAYRGLCGLVYEGGEIACNNPYPKPWTFRVRRTAAGWQGGTAWNPTQAAITLTNGVVAMNPAHIIYEALTNSDWGMGYPTSQIDTTSFLAAANQLHTEGLGLCVLWNRENTILEFLQDILNNASGVLISDRTTGLFVLKLLRDDYVISSLPVFTQDNVIELTSLESPGLVGATNEIVVSYVDPTIGSKNYGGQQNVAVQALGAIQAQGVVVSQKKDYPYLASSDLALRVAQRDLALVSTGLKRLQAKLDRNAWNLTPGDVFVLNFPALGISSVVFRVGEIDYGTLTAGAITVVAVQDVFSLPASSYVAMPVTGWVPPNATPVAPTAYFGIDTSYRDLAHRLSTADMNTLTPTSGYVELGVVRPTGLSYNYQFWSAISGGTLTWVQHGVGNWTPAAHTLAALGPFDTAAALTGGSDLQNVQLGTQAMIIDGTAFEVVRVDAIDPVALTATIARGCCDTVAQPHIAGATIWFLDGIYGGTDQVEYVAGETVDVRPQTVTTQGVLDGTLAPVISIPIVGRQALPYPPAMPTFGGVRFDLAATPLEGSVALAWKERNRVTESDTLIDQTAATITPEVGTTYNVRVYDNATNTLLTSTTGLTSPAWSFSLGAAYALRIEIESQVGSLKSWQHWSLYVAYIPSDGASISASATLTGTATQSIAGSISGGATVSGAAVEEIAGSISGSAAVAGTPGASTTSISGAISGSATVSGAAANSAGAAISGSGSVSATPDGEWDTQWGNNWNGG